MPSSDKNVLVFGAAGGVGRAAAITASKRGTKVWLAMRDPSKDIKGLSAAEEKDAGFTRIQADLSDLSSLKQAVAMSGATAAFVYTLHISEDRMRGAFETLKEAGIKYLIILSSWSVQPSAEAAKSYLFIPRFHAETEIQLAESGLRYAAVRPAYFNTNILWDVEGVKKGEVRVFGAEAIHDWLAPEDIGAVVGALLTVPKFRADENEKNGKSIYLCGPKLFSLREGWGIVSKVLGREIEVTDVSEEEFLKNTPTPPPVAESIVEAIRRSTPPNNQYDDQIYEEGVANVGKYTEREPTQFKDWVVAHKSDFV